ncbi:MAG: glycerol-3-phosphate 1-O-acyltransferase PlsY [Gammaproteobacteria bacterium]|nr:glycerol-3-phosphate 1-O-acyltransferase PlsY [Gammaproteobacteria bacterium]MDE1887510.1 glycerol-3-phosphate 1-O-acyltransferase PlsY [Gammaproteobacteria bacterium]MDE2024555.1 glycerol-3-phosphate 1-O-acyltransferase PlsY [Gammaproteobacteria bacterium]MDE2139028.1 glycerol-3-phosphate 1-O-acyltransferase PlsY [Gammaproteobacteria bacterium]MDE2273304.1 glycerol-3-phosphate 1-O-acyltransferase PlsY [Gammaproteobacteria bacterium]
MLVWLLLRILIAYLLGSLIGSLIVGKIYGGVDIRTQGSGNAGSTNALRTQGKVFALWVMLIDVGKGVLAAGLLPSLLAAPNELGLEWTAAACGAAAIIGHVFPVFFRFHGGKGFATFLGVLLMLSWQGLIVALIVWCLVLVLSGYVGLSTLMAAWSVPVFGVIVYGYTSPLFWFGLVMALFILYTHRSNIQRLATGKENRFTRVMLLRRR